ncbi:MAG TPA: hypothetical protein VFM94_06645 [Solirubrobacterales bacterium]|nr:hypothetical protein [Solirubrobacterales bacterium]
MRVIRSLAFFALASGAAFLSSGYGTGGEAEAACSATLPDPALEFVYRSEAAEKAVTPSARDRVIEVVCERLQAFAGVEGEVRALAGGRVRVLLPEGEDANGSSRLAELIGVTGQLYFYDWEPSLIGPERMAGAFPNAYGAVKLASERKPRAGCAMCSASSPRFYMFDRSTAHRLIAGPVTTRGALRRDAAGRPRRRDGIVLRVPVGTAIAFERPTSRVGRPMAGAAPGWFALRDRFALSGEEITDPKQEIDEFGTPNVTFGFTRKGRIAFQQLTREVAYRGQARAIGPVNSREAAELSGRFAVAFDGEIKTRPIVDFTQNPDGIDGRTGAQISGGFASAQEARDLATILRIGALPINLALIRRTPR